jgi:hypothetical protein
MGEAERIQIARSAYIVMEDGDNSQSTPDENQRKGTVSASSDVSPSIIPSFSGIIPTGTGEKPS